MTVLGQLKHVGGLAGEARAASAAHCYVRLRKMQRASRAHCYTTSALAYYRIPPSADCGGSDAHGSIAVQQAVGQRLDDMIALANAGGSALGLPRAAVWGPGKDAA